MKTFSGNPSSQDYFEIGRFIEILQIHRVASYLEIGARDGDTFHQVMMALPKGSRGVAVDMPGGPWGRNSESSLGAAVEDLRANGYRVNMILGSSRDAGIIDAVKAAHYDAVFIDGDHRYNGVKADWLNYGPIAHKLVAFHDIAGRGVVQKSSKLPVEVPQLWDEIKGDCRHEEIINRNSKMGIGVLFK